MAEKQIQKTEGASAVARKKLEDVCTYRPATDIVEDVEEFRAMLDLPGARPEDIDVRFENRQLKVVAAAKTNEDDRRNYLFREFMVGNYEREFNVTDKIDAEKISAETRDGQLILHLPKAGSVQPRKISVKPTS
jgi:HSP20 family protein